VEVNSWKFKKMQLDPFLLMERDLELPPGAPYSHAKLWANPRCIPQLWNSVSSHLCNFFSVQQPIMFFQLMSKPSWVGPLRRCVSDRMLVRSSGSTLTCLTKDLCTSRH
jgi:hypothetical protein